MPASSVHHKVPIPVPAFVLLLLVAGSISSGCGEDDRETALDGPTSDFVQSAAAAKGRSLYAQNGCTLCHGKQGRGDGRLARTLPKAPRDFREPENFAYGYGVAELMTTIRDGSADDAKAMPAYPHLGEPDLRDLALYIRSLSEVNAP